MEITKIESIAQIESKNMYIKNDDFVVLRGLQDVYNIIEENIGYEFLIHIKDIIESLAYEAECNDSYKEDLEYINKSIFNVIKKVREVQKMVDTPQIKKDVIHEKLSTIADEIIKYIS